MARKKKTEEPKLDTSKMSTTDILSATIEKINKKYGKNAIIDTNSISRLTNEDFLDSGSIDLNIALTANPFRGFCRGTMIEIFGWESTGKTTLMVSAAAKVQQRGGQVGIIDAEHALDPEYCRKLGLNIENCAISQPDSGEEGMDILESLIESNVMDIILVDSVAALVPQAEIDGDIGDHHIGLQARLMSQTLRKITPKIAKSKTVVLFSNQLRNKIGVMFGSPDTTTGGNALKFYASQRIRTFADEKFGPNYSTVAKDSDNYTGTMLNVKIIKNKISPPFKKASIPLIYEEGIDNLYSLIDIAEKYDIIQKAGSWYSIDGDKIGQGKGQVKNFLLENEDIVQTIHDKLQSTFTSDIFVPKEKLQLDLSPEEDSIHIDSQVIDDELELNEDSSDY